ncbi:MAG: GTPase Era [Oscillospiraceae bacterium]|nr:GTPase Era [Oscillospiraceae bacterium]
MNIEKTALITICGRPNVGKSTLANAIVGEKIAIVSNKPQTTHNRIYAVHNTEDTQLVFMDTPGYHRPKSRLDEYMAEVVRESFSGTDAVVLVVEPIANVGPQETQLIEYIKNCRAPSVLVINKIDTIAKEELLAVIAAYAEVFEFAHIMPISAKTGDGVKELLDLLCGFAMDGPPLFPEDMVTDQPDRQICAEMVREKLLYCLDHEIPHGTAVEVTRFTEREDTEIIDLDVTIYCEKASHKSIIIGKGGSMLKKIGALARKDIERYMGTKVYLQTWVKVKENWRDSDFLVRNFGYRSDD